uniref:Innexin n=1 Tax=Tetranychus urticae TaxID=32264 RepID=T1KDH8_TETUR
MFNHHPQHPQHHLNPLSTSVTTVASSVHRTKAHLGSPIGSLFRSFISWPLDSQLITSIIMIDVFKSLRTLFKISRVHIDNSLLRLHYSLTVTLLLAFCVVVTTKQYVGDPIDCIKDENIPQSVINTYCWIHTTYTIPRALARTGSRGLPHPGIDSTQDEAEFRYHKYYQWVCFVLFIQAALFYIPRWLWKMWEGGKIATLMMDLDVGICTDTAKRQKKKLLVDYLTSSKGYHDWYAARFFFCEILFFANVAGQMYMLDKFFEGEFLRYGIEVIQFFQMDQEDRVDPMTRIFPKVTKCRFYKYGPSAGLISIDALCLLPLNIINEKIYIFIWFWFFTLTFLTGSMILVHLIVIACPPVRVYLLNMQFRLSQLDHLHTIVRRTSIGDWFLLYMLGQNIDPVVFKEVLEDLATSSDSQPKESSLS